MRKLLKLLRDTVVLPRPRHRREDGIKIDLREIGSGGGGVEWIHLAQDRDRWRAVVNAPRS
jgi:hypothetical protein